MVASDRISAFDFVLPTPIPDKGRVLTALSLWWFDQLADLVPNHVIVSIDVPAGGTPGARCCADRLEMFPVECVARGYLTGSGLHRLPGRPVRSAASPLPAGLVDGSRLPDADLHPGDQGRLGEHDENVELRAVAATVGAAEAAELRDSPSRSTPGRARSRASAASCSPTRSSSSAATPTARLSWATRC